MATGSSGPPADKLKQACRSRNVAGRPTFSPNSGPPVMKFRESSKVAFERLFCSTKNHNQVRYSYPAGSRLNKTTCSQQLYVRGSCNS